VSAAVENRGDERRPELGAVDALRVLAEPLDEVRAQGARRDGRAPSRVGGKIRSLFSIFRASSGSR
jgi:hypothetical protein